LGPGKDKESYGMNEYDRCFACGQANPWGLKLIFHQDKNGVWADVVFHKNYEGYPDIVHGGIVTTVLDEAMAKAVLARGVVAYTAELRVRLKKKAVPGEKYRVYGRLISSRRNLYELEAVLRKGEEVIAEAHARFLAPGK